MNRNAGAGPAVLTAIVLAVILLVLGSSTPGRALRAFFISPVVNPYYLGNMLSMAGLLLLGALGISISFRAGMFNIGGEGQVYAGALSAALVALWVPITSPVPARLAVFAAAGLAGAVLAGMSGLLRRLAGLPELITSFLLSASVMPLIDALIIGPARDRSRSLLATRGVPEALRLPRLLPPSELSTSLILALLVAAVAFVYLFRTTRGYELRITGQNPSFAHYSGIRVGENQVRAMLLSGALHGMVGAAVVLGSHYAAVQGGTAGLGWNAIAVALIGRLHPVLCVPAAAAFAYLDAGSKASMLHTEFTFELVAILQAVILFLVTAQIALPRLRLPRLRRRPPRSGP